MWNGEAARRQPQKGGETRRQAHRTHVFLIFGFGRLFREPTASSHLIMEDNFPIVCASGRVVVGKTGLGAPVASAVVASGGGTGTAMAAAPAADGDFVLEARRPRHKGRSLCRLRTGSYCHVACPESLGGVLVGWALEVVEDFDGVCGLGDAWEACKILPHNCRPQWLEHDNLSRVTGVLGERDQQLPERALTLACRNAGVGAPPVNP